MGGRSTIPALVAALLVAIAAVARAQGTAAGDDSFLPVVVERSETISITTNADPDILPGLRPLPPESFAGECIDLAETHADETKAIARHADVVARKGDPRRNSELQIRLAQDRTIRFFDYPCGENFASYVFVDLLPRAGFALVRHSIYEDYSYLAVSLATGRVSRMLDTPVPSPDGRRFASYRYDQLNGITELTLYAIGPDRVVVEASCEVVIAEEDRVGAPKWQGVDIISFVVQGGDAPFPAGPTLKRQGKDWVLQGPATFTLEGRRNKPLRQICRNTR